MANPTLVHAATSGNVNADSTSCTITSSTPENDLIVFVFFDGLTNVITSLTDNLSQVYTLRGTIQNNNGNDYTIACYYKHLSAGGVTSVTAQITHTTSREITCVMVLEYSNVSGFGQFPNAFTTGTTSIGASTTLQNNGNMLVGGIFTFGTYTATAGTVEVSTVMPALSIGTATILVSDNASTANYQSKGNTGTASSSGGSAYFMLELSNSTLTYTQNSGWSGFVGGTSVPWTINNVAANDLLVGVLQYGGASVGSTFTFSDTVNTWQVIAAARNDTANGPCLIAYAKGVAATPGTLTVTASTNGSASNLNLQIFDFGANANTVLDVGGNNHTAAGVPSVSITLGAANEIVVAFCNDGAGESIAAPMHVRNTANNGFGDAGDNFETSSGSKTYQGTSSGNGGIVAAAFSAPLSQAATPTFAPPAGTYAGARTVTITSSTAGGTIYYTTDGSTPTHGSPSISNGGTINVTVSETVKALASVTGFLDSAVGSAAYVINPASSDGIDILFRGRLYVTRVVSGL